MNRSISRMKRLRVKIIGKCKLKAYILVRKNIPKTLRKINEMLNLCNVFLCNFTKSNRLC